MSVRAPSRTALQAEGKARLRFEMLLADVCAEFVNVTPRNLDSKIEYAQRLICEALGVDHSSVWQVSEGNSDAFVMTHSYRDSSLKPLPSWPILKDYFPWTLSKILKKEIVSIPNTANVPPEAATDKKSWLQFDIRSTLAFPLAVGGGAVVGLLAFDSTKERDWTEPLQRRLQILAHAFAQALDRKNSERKVRERENRKNALLQAREELLRVFVKNVPAAVAMLDRDMRYLQVSDRWCTDYLADREQILGRSHYEVFHDMPERWKEVHRRALQGDTLRADEDRWDGQDGPHWARWEVRPWKTPEGTVGGILILAEDITRRKQMEEALSGMSRKLIKAQEKERVRIGSELHDDIGQRLALLAIELEELHQNPVEVQRRVEELRKRTIEVANDVQALSHDLHSSKLEYLGVIAGMKSWCKEFAERSKVEINFRNEVSSVVPFEMGVSLFRVLQEALHNAVKHSGVKRIAVQLYQESAVLHLIISDLGKGFDVEAARRGRGLGLTNMQERARLVNGTVVIESKPMGGTKIHVRVPLTPEHGTERVAV